MYRFVSDQFSSFYTKVINANARDAVHVLDGLLYHETDISIDEHYTDTAGYTDQVFGLTHLLGFRFAPRIRDISEHLKATQGMDDNLLRHIAPLGWEHVNFLGVYNFDGKNTLVENILRPLNV